MELTEEEIFKKYGTLCKNCTRNLLLTYEYEWRCIFSRYNIIKRKHELSETSRKKLNLPIVQNMLNTKILVFVWMYIKHIKVMI